MLSQLPMSQRIQTQRGVTMAPATNKMAASLNNVSDSLSLSSKNKITANKAASPGVKFGAWNDLHQAIMNAKNKPADSTLRAQLKNISPEKLNEQDEDGCTPLHIAASNGFDKIVRLLLSKSGIDKHIGDFEDNTTAREMAEGIDDPKAKERVLKAFDDNAGGRS